MRPSRRLILLAALGITFLGGGTALSYYVEALWFDSLGLANVFWTTVNVQTTIFAAFGITTFAVLYGAFLALKPSRLANVVSPILVNGQPLQLPVEPVLRLIGGAVALLLSAITSLSMAGAWTRFALYWHQSATPATPSLDPIFGKDITFYLFTLPVWQLVAGWLTTLAVIICAAAVFFAVVAGGSRLIARQAAGAAPLRGVSVALAGVLLLFALQVYLGRFERITADHTIFSGVTYTDDHVTIPGMLAVSIALVVGAAMLLVNAVAAPKVRWMVASIAPAVAVFIGVSVTGWYVNGFVVKPNELVRESPYIAHNIAMTRDAYGLDDIEEVSFPAEAGLAAMDAENNQETLQNIRLWDWRALQDTLRQIQQLRTYYDFPDIDIDRYTIDGQVKQMMLAVRELHIDRLPESSRNWINERLVYTHGYGVTMNPVNGFTPEGLPDLLLRNMPVENRSPSITVTRPEIYFGELTDSDVYVKTNQQEFNYPQGDTNNVTSYEGSGGIVLGGLLRRFVIALDRGDVTRMPFSDAVTAESRLLMRRNIRDRVSAVAPFLSYDDDPYIIVTADGRLLWMLDGFTTSDAYPYARHYGLNGRAVNYLRNSVKVTIDAYDGLPTFYVFDSADPIINAYRGLFPTLFKDASTMPADVRAHVRYPEMLLQVQATVYGLYHMTAPDMFYNREDLWTIASEVTMTDRRDQAAQPMEPNFVLMKLPGESGIEFIEILPFTPANRNNLIGWIAGRSDGEHYGRAIVYNFPESRLVDGPLQIEARVDQNAQLSAQLSLWNQQGSRVRRGNLIVIPVGKGLLYAQPIYLQSDRSPMPELRIVVLALQDRLAYGPSFETALASLFGRQPSSLTPPVAGSIASGSLPPPAPGVNPGPNTPQDVDSLISDAARHLSDYQRLTAEGRLAEAGQRLQALKETLDRLAQSKR